MTATLLVAGILTVANQAIFSAEREERLATAADILVASRTAVLDQGLTPQEQKRLVALVAADQPAAVRASAQTIFAGQRLAVSVQPPELADAHLRQMIFDLASEPS